MIIGSNILSLENLTSTNSYAIRLASEKQQQEGTIIQTNYQSAGRGQPGNRWESENGRNLLLSIILYPSVIQPVDQFLISMTISLGIQDFLSRQMESCSIKWPNDLYIKNDKIAGILIENSLMNDRIVFSVAGIGLNVNQEKFMSGAPNPVSMKLVTGIEYDLGECMKNLIRDLDKRYMILISGNIKTIRDEYQSRLYRFNEWYQYKDAEGKFKGRILSVSDHGKLNIEKRSGTIRSYYFKEIDFIL